MINIKNSSSFDGLKQLLSGDTNNEAFVMNSDSTEILTQDAVDFNENQLNTDVDIDEIAEALVKRLKYLGYA